MHLSIPKNIDNGDLLKIPHKGRVVKNNDPDKLGRIKCVVKGLFEDKSDDCNRLPWIFPQNPIGLGGKPDCSAFCVPELDAEVTITFPFRDIYHPFYVGFWQSELTHTPGLWDEDYPDSYGWVDSIIQWFRVNKKVKYIEFFRSTLSDMFRLDEKGTLTINIPKSVVLKIGEDVYVKVTGAVTLKSDGNIAVSTGANHELKTGGNHGVDSGGFITHQASKIDHNSGIKVGIVPGAEATLISRIQDLEKKVEELKKIADSTINPVLESNRPNIAKP